MDDGTDENSKSKICNTGCQDSVARSPMVEQHPAELIGLLVQKTLASFNANNQEIRSAAGAVDPLEENLADFQPVRTEPTQIGRWLWQCGAATVAFQQLLGRLDPRTKSCPRKSVAGQPQD